MDKHAYLIMAHTDYNCLLSLVLRLDNEKNDIFIHIDKKWKNFNRDEIENSIKKSSLFFIKSKAISWGGASQIRCELNLLEAACTNCHYQYYHLLSGQDMPLKSNQYIFDFFESNAHKQYISFDKNANGVLECNDPKWIKRVECFWLFQDAIGREYSFIRHMLKQMQNMFISVQENAGYRRYPNRNFYKGANWFSITDDMVRYIVKMKSQIIKDYRFTFCADEIFLQTLAMESPFKEQIAFDNKRLIDWRRGTPYTYKIKDIQILSGNNKLFARKFDSRVDEEIIRLLGNINYK